MSSSNVDDLVDAGEAPQHGDAVGQPVERAPRALEPPHRASPLTSTTRWSPRPRACSSSWTCPACSTSKHPPAATTTPPARTPDRGGNGASGTGSGTTVPVAPSGGDHGRATRRRPGRDGPRRRSGPPATPASTASRRRRPGRQGRGPTWTAKASPPRRRRHGPGGSARRRGGGGGLGEHRTPLAGGERDRAAPSEAATAPASSTSQGTAAAAGRRTPARRRDRAPRRRWVSPASPWPAAGPEAVRVPHRPVARRPRAAGRASDLGQRRRARARSPRPGRRRRRPRRRRPPPVHGPGGTTGSHPGRRGPATGRPTAAAASPASARRGRGRSTSMPARPACRRAGVRRRRPTGRSPTSRRRPPSAASVAARAAPPGRHRSMGESTTGAGASRHTRVDVALPVDVEQGVADDAEPGADHVRRLPGRPVSHTARIEPDLVGSSATG